MAVGTSSPTPAPPAIHFLEQRVVQCGHAVALGNIRSAAQPKPSRSLGPFLIHEDILLESAQQFRLRPR